MVDFNSETTITRPAADVCKIVILQRRYDFLEALTEVYVRQANNSSLNLGHAKALLSILAKELGAMFRGRFSKKDGETWADLLTDITGAENIETLTAAFDRLDAELYRMGLTKIDTGREYDSTLVETENREKGL